MMSLWDALRMNMMISYQELVRTFLSNDVKSIGFSLTSSVDNILHFFAAYKALKNNVQPGDANASVSFIVTYD